LRQKSSYADVVSLSASKDEQEAIETERGGALRWAFIESVRTLGHNLTYKELLCSVRYVRASCDRMKLKAVLLATT